MVGRGILRHHSFMAEILLYPTETLYALGVNALDTGDLRALLALKGREPSKVASWLVRSVDDIRTYADMDAASEALAAAFLPGPLTLVLRVRSDIAPTLVAPDSTIGFRVSKDIAAHQVVTAFMDTNDAPLTCTSANVSGAPCLSTPQEILQQFGPKAGVITSIIDDGPRKGLASTVVRVMDGQVDILREGSISEREILRAVGR